MMRTLLFLLLSVHSFAQLSTDIHFNQEGFYTDAPKFAVLTGTVNADLFYILGNNSDTVFRGHFTAAEKSKNSSLICRTMNFSELTKAGTYRIFVPGIGGSHHFTISDHAFFKSAVASLKAYYFLRSSVPLDAQYAGKWNRPAGHADDRVEIHSSAASEKRPVGTMVSSPGGWYDAGDYNKYIVNSGITMGTLLSAYEDFPSYFDQLRTQIPESANQIPDLIDEIIYNLRWMLTMQDPNDGGVYHKCTNADFDGMVMPGVTRLPRYLVQKSTAATLDFVAVTAQAARVLKKFDKQLPGLSDSCRNAAINAWQWSIKNPGVLYHQAELNKKYEPKINTGAYGDGNLKDEWFWAASELFVTTLDKTFEFWIIDRLEGSMRLVSWNSVGMAGAYSIIRHEKNLPPNFINNLATIKARVKEFADSLLSHANTNAFHTVMGGSPNDFVWGSNGVAANQGIALINAYLMTRDRKYLDGALSNADHILGRNATGYCFITGMGLRSPMHPHHRPSVADGIEEPVPGLVAGGPNPGRQDGCKYAFTEPETSYVDDDCSYASNEIAINWNAPVVYLLNGLEYLLNQK
jgi:endoglucanase